VRGGRLVGAESLARVTANRTGGQYARDQGYGHPSAMELCTGR